MKSWCFDYILAFCLSLFPFSEIKSQVRDETQAYPVEADLMLFMGQSNMGGRGKVTSAYPEDAPKVTKGAGYEFRAVSDPTRLYPIDKRMGENENRTDGIDDGTAKTGGCVPSFVNKYYALTGMPIIAVSASEGGTYISSWQPATQRIKDATFPPRGRLSRL